MERRCAVGDEDNVERIKPPFLRHVMKTIERVIAPVGVMS